MNKIPVSERANNIEYAIRDVVLPAKKIEEQGHSVLKLNIGDPLAYPGFPTPDHMVQAYSDALNRQYNGYTDSYGIQELREAISFDENNKENGGWKCSSENVYICHGVTEALQIIFASFLSDGDKVLAPGPHYPPYMAYPQLFGGKTVEYKLDGDNDWQIDLQDLESKFDNNVKLLVLINPNNPTGSVLNKVELNKILRIVQKWPNCTIISDEIYDKIHFSNNHISLASLSNDVPIITLNGVSKAYYAPGWRIGYMAIHDPLNKLEYVKMGMEKILRSRLCPSTPAQYGYLSGLVESKNWMNTYNSTLLERRNLCLERIKNIEGLEVVTPGGSFYMFIKIINEKWQNNDRQFALELLKKYHVLVVHGSGFSANHGKGYFRIVFLPTVDIINRSFDKINLLLNK